MLTLARKPQIRLLSHKRIKNDKAILF